MVKKKKKNYLTAVASTADFERVFALNIKMSKKKNKKNAKTLPGPPQTSKMERFATIVTAENL